MTPPARNSFIFTSENDLLDVQSALFIEGKL